MKKEHLAYFDIAGFTFYDGTLAFKELEIATLLRLELDSEIKNDPGAVVIYFGEHKLGFIPRSENPTFYKLFTVELEKHIEVRIQRISKDENPEHQIAVVAHLVN